MKGILSSIVIYVFGLKVVILNSAYFSAFYSWMLFACAEGCRVFFCLFSIN